MAQGNIKCPSCKFDFPLDEILLESIKEDLEQKLNDKRKELVDKEKGLNDREKNFEDKLGEELKIREEKITGEARKKAVEDVNLELSNLKNEMSEKKQKLENYEKDNLDLLAKERKRQDELINIKKEMKEKEKNFTEELEREKDKAKSVMEKEFSDKYDIEMRREKGKANEQINLLNEKLNKASEEEIKFIREKEKLIEELNGKEREYLSKRLEEREKVRTEIKIQAEKEHQLKLKEAKKQADEAYRLKEREKDLMIDGLKKEADALKRRLEQGSQQLQGEAAEEAMMEVLRTNFPMDSIEEIKKGVSGADLIQGVGERSGVNHGKILWEVKNTRNWSEKWISKLKEDQVKSNADLSVLVTKAMPNDVKGFVNRDGIYVTEFDLVVPLANLLRATLMEIYKIKQAAVGAGGKKDLLFKYITGPEFRQRIQLKVDSYIQMKKNLDKEKNFLTKQWATREKELEKIVFGTIELWGDFDGILGGSLKSIRGIDPLALEEGDE